jgi:hypothetical protein
MPQTLTLCTARAPLGFFPAAAACVPPPPPNTPLSLYSLSLSPLISLISLLFLSHARAQDRAPAATRARAARPPSRGTAQARPAPRATPAAASRARCRE